MDRFQWLRFLARNGRIQSRGQYHYPGLDDSPEQQNICPHAQMLIFYFNGEIPVAVISCTKCQKSISRTVSLSWAGWQSWGTKSMPAHKNPAILFEWRKLQWLWFLARNGRIQSWGQYHHPGIKDSPEEQNLYPYAKVLLFYFNGEIPVAVISCTKWQKSISRTVSLSWAGG